MSDKTIKVLLRMPKELHDVLRTAAQNDMRSLHNYVLRMLMDNTNLVSSDTQAAPKVDTKKTVNVPDFPYED